MPKIELMKKINVNQKNTIDLQKGTIHNMWDKNVNIIPSTSHSPYGNIIENATTKTTSSTFFVNANERIPSKELVAEIKKNNNPATLKVYIQNTRIVKNGMLIICSDADSKNRLQ